MPGKRPQTRDCSCDPTIVGEWLLDSISETTSDIDNCLGGLVERKNDADGMYYNFDINGYSIAITQLLNEPLMRIFFADTQANGGRFDLRNEETTQDIILEDNSTFHIRKLDESEFVFWMKKTDSYDTDYCELTVLRRPELEEGE